MSGIETRILGLIEAWESVRPKATGIADLKHVGIPLPIHDLINWLGITIVPFNGTRLGIYTGWLVSVFVYVALFYATFLYCWPSRSNVLR